VRLWNFRLAATALTTVALALGISATPVQAAPADETRSPDAAWSTGQNTVSAITDRLARQLASPLADPVRPAMFSAAVTAPVDLATIDAGSALTRTIAQANRAVLAAKGLPEDDTSLLQVRLGHPDLRDMYHRGAAALIAAEPTDDVATTFTAYDLDGGKVILPTDRLPARPVFVVEVDTEKAAALGLKMMRAMLDARGLGSAASDIGIQGYWANKVTAIRLNYDHEPLIKGAAEIFGIAGGFGFDGHVRVDIVTMPYLDNDNTTYYPNQVIVHYGRYKYNFADFVMYEDDGDTNYQLLATFLIDALLIITDLGYFIPVANAIIDAMPDSWWTDDPDYTDSWYTLSTSTSGRRYGAASNGWMDIQPYWVA